MVHLPLAKTVNRYSLDMAAQAKRQSPQHNRQLSELKAPGIGNSRASTQNITITHLHQQQPQQQEKQQQQQQQGGNSAHPARPSIEVRHDVVGGSNPAKARMLWREGFTPNEIENSSMNEKEVKRQEVMFEIIHTEADYVKDLRIAVDILQSPMQQLRIVSAEKIELIFGNLQEILDLHSEINTAFMERQRKQYPVLWDISDVLLPFVSRFRVYARYICNQDKALQLVEELKRTRNNFAVFHKERQRRPECRNLPIEAFLALPFQRLLKYPLLIRTLLASTEEWSQQHANGRLVADQVDAWIRKIQDARAKLDSFACVDALSRCIGGVDWPALMQTDHRLAHCGPVRTGDEPATMWLFDAFVLIARAEPASSGPMSILPRASFSSGRSADVHDHHGPPGSGGGGGNEVSSTGVPAPNMQYRAVFGPCQVVEALDLAQYKGSPAVLLRALPLLAPGQAASQDQGVSVAVHFASKAEHTLWRTKLDAHVRRTLEQTPALSADILADAIARARIVDDDGPGRQHIGQTRSPPSSGFPSANASVSDIPTISVREVYVQFPAARQKGKLRRGWDFLCSKTEDITGQGIKRQLRKYGGGGGKRRATDPPSQQQMAMHRRLSRGPAGAARSSHVRNASRGSANGVQPPALLPSVSAASQVISEPMAAPPSPSYVHVAQAHGPSADNGASPLRPMGGSMTVMPQRRARHQTLPASAIYQQPSVTTASLGSFGSASRDSVVLRSYAGYTSRQSEDALAGVQPARFEVGSATLAYAAGGGSSSRSSIDAASVSAGTTYTGRTLSTLARPSPLNETHDDITMSDSDASLSDADAAYPAHAGTRSGSTLFVPAMQSSASLGARPKPLPVPPAARTRHGRVAGGQRKPAPVFEVGSAKLTYGERAHELVSSMPGFQSSHWHAASLARHTSALRSWQSIDMDEPGSANSTDSFCIVNHEPPSPAAKPGMPPARIVGSSHEL
ncbi:Rho guanine nucleotide exchange factor 3 [Coemansia interrupta]|uniref:Rho guanine nucleotide exchange factor 3 n=1 Tax=Coemansia interrupta TaxID=1126814 RepID=A0A9W8HKD1_9FUNG|nr:Rho guanine nucleotide exchange factor 3 [Coemansia interrupta]